MKIAIIEDSLYLSHILREALTENKYIARVFRTGEAALEHIPTEEYDLCLVDVNLPDMDGYQIVKKLRTTNPDVLIIFLTIRDNVSDKIKGFEVGADDYVTKPFDMGELLARIKALLKRKGQRTPNIVKLGELEVHTDSQSIKYKEKELVLTVKEFHILEFLIHKHGMIVSRDQLTDLIWDSPYEISPNIVSLYMGKLRTKLQELTGSPCINTIKNKGYIFNAP